MRYKEVDSGNFNGQVPERCRKVVNPGAFKTGSAIEDLKKIGGKSFIGFKNKRKIK